MVHDKICYGGKVWICRTKHERSEERKLVKTIDTGRKLDKADRDHLEHIAAGQCLIRQIHQSSSIASMKFEVRTAHG